MLSPANHNWPANSFKMSVALRVVFHVVKAAVAKERMRNLIAWHLESLSGPEVKFLTAMVNSEDVTLEQLANAIDVLDNAPLYNPSLRWRGGRVFCCH